MRHASYELPGQYLPLLRDYLTEPAEEADASFQRGLQLWHSAFSHGSTVRSIAEVHRLVLEAVLGLTRNREECAAMASRAFGFFADCLLHHYAQRRTAREEIRRAVLMEQSPEELVRAVLPPVRALIPCRSVCVVIFDFGADDAALVTCADADHRVRMGKTCSRDAVMNIEALREDRVQVVQDLLAISDPPPAALALLENGLRAYVEAPMVSGSRLTGAFGLGTDEPDAFTLEHLEIARELAVQLTVAVQRYQWQEQLRSQASDPEPRVVERSSELLKAKAEAFSHSISHELRAPIRAAEGLAQALLEDYAGRLDSVGQDYVRRIIAAAQRMHMMIQGLLAYNGLCRATIQLAPVCLASVLTEALAELKPDLQEREAHVIVQEPFPSVIGHHTTLVQIVTNLLTNAVKFVARGAQPRVRIWADAQDGRVRLWVEDNGIGIAPEHQERIFGVFERLHGIESYPGTGIGLAIVRRGVECMGGRAGVESAPAQGSRFWVELRQAEEPS